MCERWAFKYACECVIKVESGGMEVGRNRKEVEENCDHFSMVFVEESEHPAPRYGCAQTLSSLC